MKMETAAGLRRSVRCVEGRLHAEGTAYSSRPIGLRPTVEPPRLWVTRIIDGGGRRIRESASSSEVAIRRLWRQSALQPASAMELRTQIEVAPGSEQLPSDGVRNLVGDSPDRLLRVHAD